MNAIDERFNIDDDAREAESAVTFSALVPAFIFALIILLVAPLSFSRNVIHGNQRPVRIKISRTDGF